MVERRTNLGFGVPVTPAQEEEQGPDPLAVDAYPPGSEGSDLPTPAPQWFTERLGQLGYILTWHPARERHVIWNSTDHGLKVVMVCQNPYPHEWAGMRGRGPMPLDNRVFALLHDSDPRFHGGWKGLFAQVQAQQDREIAAREQRNREREREALHLARMHTAIRSGYGRSRGDKSVTHSVGHDDSPLPKDFRL